MNDYLIHFGTKHHSGRYPYGSGERPFQGEGGTKNSKTTAKDYIASRKKLLSKPSMLMSNEELHEQARRIRDENLYNEKQAKIAKNAVKVIGGIALTGAAIAGATYIINNKPMLQKKITDAVKREIVNAGKRTVESMKSEVVSNLNQVKSNVNNQLKQTRVKAATSDFGKAYVNNPAVKVVGSVADKVSGRNPQKFEQVRRELSNTTAAKRYVNNPAVKVAGSVADKVSGRRPENFDRVRREMAKTDFAKRYVNNPAVKALGETARKVQRRRRLK